MTVTGTAMSSSELQRAARDHLLLHFTPMAAYGDDNLPIYVRGDGCHIEDADGKRYLDGLAGLFCVQIGYGFGEEIGAAAAAQLQELPFYLNWSCAHPPAIELAAEIASLAPEGLNRVFFVNSGSEAIEAVWKLARQYHAANGERRWKVVSRRWAYHGVTAGALSINGIPGLRTPFEPLVPDVVHVQNTNRYRRPPDETEEEHTTYLLAELEDAIQQAVPSTVAAIVIEPVQNAGGAFVAPAGYHEGVRAICDRHGILLAADEVVTSFGRFGEWFGSPRYSLEPDIVACAKGLSSGHAPIGAVIANDRVMEPFVSGKAFFSHGATFGGHPVAAAIALKNLEIMRREAVLENVRENEGAFKSALEQLLDIPLVGDVRGEGYLYAIGLTRNRETRDTGFSQDERDGILKGFMAVRIRELGLLCRVDERGDPIVQLSPPLIAGPQEIDELVGILGTALSETSKRLKL